MENSGRKGKNPFSKLKSHLGSSCWGECYFLRVLLNNVAGATSYEHLRMVDGVLLPSFREAAERRGLIEEDNTLD
jgi:hypothetical protein